MNELEKIIHAILHAFHLDHGVPADAIEVAKADASIAIKAIVGALIPVAEHAAEAFVAAEVPSEFAPVADAALEQVLAAGEAEAVQVFAPEADASLSPDAPMVQV